jgi:hypothetical protein
VGTALIALVAVAPWLGITPIASSALLNVVLGGVTFAAACHGAGQGIALVTRRGLAEPMLAIVWGLATLIVTGGVLAALHVFSPMLLVGGAAGLHTLIVLSHQAPIRAWLARSAWHWSVPWIALLAIVGFVQLAGAAGALTARPFDDDGNVAGQIARLAQTGTLADAIGYPRFFQLGGNAVLGALAGDAWLALAIDRGLCFVLAIALVCTRIRPVDAATGLWAVLVVLVMAAFAFVAPDAAPCWSGVLLLVALYITIEDLGEGFGAAAPLALLAAALVALRSEFAPAAFTTLIGAWVLQDRERQTIRRLVLVVAATLVAIAPFVIARQLAWSSLDGAQTALLEPRLPALAIRAAVFVAVLAIACPLVSLISLQRWPAFATAAGIAGIVSELAGDRPYATRFVWPLVLALALVLVIHLARRAMTAASFIVATCAVLLVFEGSTVRSRLAWTQRYAEMLAGVEYLRHEPAERMYRDYNELLARVPAGATVAVWVTHPERLDHARHRIVDLRTPRVSRYRELVRAPHRPKLHSLLRGARYLLVESDDRWVQRSQGDLVHRLLCRELGPGCADDLELLLLRPAVAERGNLRVIAL